MVIRGLVLVGAAFGWLATCVAQDAPVLRGGREPFTFAVLGDIHYKPPEYAVSDLVHRVAQEIRALRPAVALVCQTGDIVEGGSYMVRNGKRAFSLSGYEEMKSQHTFAVADLSESFRLPLFTAVGNHDKHDPQWRAYRETFLPLIARNLGRPVAQTFYAFRYGNACFVFLDSTPLDDDEQGRFLDRVLTEVRRAGGTEHVFLFAHYPLWTVVRPAFHNPKFTAAIMAVLARHRVDAYFCGHTHNAIVCVRDLQGTRVTQIQGVTTTSTGGLIPIETRHALLFPAEQTPYCWGYREDSPAGYYLVRVEGQRVNVQWRLPGQGVLRESYWQTPGALVDVKRPAAEKRVAVDQAALARARQAAIVIHPWAENRTPVTVLLNGEPLVEAEIKPAYGLFWHEQRIAIPAAKLDRLRTVNRLQLANPSGAVFGFASARLEATLADGTPVATPPDRNFCFSLNRAQLQGKNQHKAWQAAPPEMVRAVPLGQPLGPVELRFAD